jgi:hypothetical protein
MRLLPSSVLYTWDDHCKSHAQILSAHVHFFYRWGLSYDHGENSTRDTMLNFAATKLLCASPSVSEKTLTNDQKCAVLSQRLALDINSSAYVTSGSTRNYEMAYKAQLQISNHMRVCIAIPEDLVAVRGVAASEPILSEAASSIMSSGPTPSKFDLPNALIDVLDSYAIDHGERGELLVAALFTRARDKHVHETMARERRPLQDTQLCPIFSVNDLLAALFYANHFSNMSSSLPSVYRTPECSRREVHGRLKKYQDALQSHDQTIPTGSSHTFISTCNDGPWCRRIRCQ